VIGPGRVARSIFECKAKQYQEREREKSLKNFNILFKLASHEKLHIHVITILPTGMSGTHGINLIQC